MEDLSSIPINNVNMEKTATAIVEDEKIDIESPVIINQGKP